MPGAARGLAAVSGAADWPGQVKGHGTLARANTVRDSAEYSDLHYASFPVG